MFEAGSSVTIADCRLVEFPIRGDRRGKLTVIEGGEHIPFEIARVFYLEGVPDGATRAGHANRCSDQVLVALAGSFEVTLDDGIRREATRLEHSGHGLFLPRMVWRELAVFSPGAICLALASDAYDEDDYHRDYGEYLKAIASG
jgi:hypothetical protein